MAENIKKILCILVCIYLVSVNSSASENQVVDIAAIYALTGAAAENNRLSLEGISYGVEELNAAGGILGKKVNLVKFDNQSTPIGSTLAAIKAAQSNAVAILGPAWSSHSLPAARVAQKMKIPMISNVSTNSNVTRVGDFIFRVCFTDLFQGKALAKFARQDLKAETAVMFINVASDYSLELSKIFKLNFEKSGGTVLQELEYKTNQMNPDNEINQVVKSGSSVVFIPGHDESGAIASRIQAAGSKSIFLGGDGWASQAFLSKGGKDLNHAYYCTHWSSRLEYQKNHDFLEKYIPSEISAANIALGYDAVMLLADAINRADSFDRKRIRQALSETTYFEGVTGKIRFNDEGDPDKSAVFMGIKKGKPYYLKTLSSE